MNKQTVVAMMAGMVPVLGWAQTAPVMDYPARVQSVENLKQHIAQREERFEALKQDLRALDERVEKQVDHIVKTLATLKDSQDSKTRVANLKGDVMKALVRNIGVFRQKRASIYDRARRDPNAPQGQLEKELEVLDGRVNKRIEQVMELSRSFPGHQDVAKYESDGDSYWNGWSNESTRISEDWKQNRRDSNSSDVVRREMLQKLDKALETAQAQRASIADALANRKMSEQERKAQQEELGRLDATIDNLRMRRREAALPGAGASRELGRDEIHDVEELLDDARADLSRDFGDIICKFDELDREGTKINAMRENLKAREEWLKNNPPPEKK